MATPWHLARMCPLDTETTSPNPEEARIVEAYVGRVGGGQPPVDRPPLLIDPGVEVPAEATKIHGYTTEHLREHGVPAEVGVGRIAAAVAEAILDGVPLVGHNIVFDLTILDRELVRHDLPSLADLAATAGRPLYAIDTYVISKRLDRWRRRVSEDQGAHALKTCAQVFGIPWVDEDAHGARYDALISARVAWRMGCIAATPREFRPNVQAGRGDDRHLFDDLAVDLPALHASQQKWAAEQAASFRDYLAKQGKPAGDVRGDWPIVPADIVEGVIV